MGFEHSLPPDSPELERSPTMEKITITINTGNAAFTEEPASMIAHILRGIADNMECKGTPSNCESKDGTFSIHDINGNRCGEVSIEGGL